MLVAGDRARRVPVPSHDSEPRGGFAAKPAGLALNRLTEDLGERDTAPASFALEDREVVAVGGDGGAPNHHASDASIVGSA
jgi:hypothetical protein